MTNSDLNCYTWVLLKNSIIDGILQEACWETIGGFMYKYANILEASRVCGSRFMGSAYVLDYTIREHRITYGELNSYKMTLQRLNVISAVTLHKNTNDVVCL